MTARTVRARVADWLRRTPPLRVAVVTPVGPGHAELYAECRASVAAAWRQGHGPFAALDCVAIDDGAGRLGRSRARNEGIARAVAGGADWLFFLDADDLMVAGAFEAVAPFVAGNDAVWGLILGLAPGAARPHLRVPQIVAMDRLDDLLLFDPFLTLQMGHFVRAPLAQRIGFDESLDAGEDFDYYLRLWSSARAVKVAREFFVNRHARRSGGPRAASAEQWGAAVRTRQRAERAQRGLQADGDAARALGNARIAELHAFCREQALVDAADAPALSAQLPFAGVLEVNEYEGGTLRLHYAADDVACAHLAWTGEYRPFAAALWQALAAAAGTVIDIGGGDGLFALLAARVAPGARVLCCEAGLAARARDNLALNGVAGVDWVVADGEAAGSAVAARLDRSAAAPFALHVAGAGAADALRGLAPGLAAARAELLLELAPADAPAAVRMLQACGYGVGCIDEAGHAVSVCAVAPPAGQAAVVELLASARGVAGLRALVADARGRLHAG